MDAEDFYYPASASPRYTIIEISMFEGRAIETRKNLIRLLFERVGAQCERAPNEIEVTITETPRHNWGFRGLPGDEIGLRLQGGGLRRRVMQTRFRICD